MESKNVKLIRDLKEAAQFLRDEDFDCLFSSFDDAEQFASELDKIRLLIETRSINPLKILNCFYLRKKAKLFWFTPTNDWDDTVSGEKGLRLGNDIFNNL